MKLNLELIQHINFFEKITKTRVKNCFSQGDKLIFIVNEGQGSKAIGKNAVNVHKISKLIKKKIKIVEYIDDQVKFIGRFVAPIKIEDVEVSDGIISMKAKTTKEKGLLIGRNGQNLKNVKEVISHYFKIKEVKVV